MNNSQDLNHLLIIEDRKNRRIIYLEENSYSLGRDPGNSLMINEDRNVSRFHATLVKKEASTNNHHSYWIFDGDLNGKKSTNGLLINGQSRSKHELKHGDIIKFGDHANARYYILDSASVQKIFQLDKKLNKPSLSQAKAKNKQHQQTMVLSERLNQFSQEDLVRLASFPELSPNPIIELDLVGNITYLNSAAIVKFNNIYKAKLEHPLLMGLLTESKNLNGNLLVREVKIDEQVFEQYVHYLTESGLIRSYIFDITERKRAEEVLSYQASHDLLTDLPNRMLFNQRLSTAIANAKSNQQLIAVMFVDLDRFKKINDTLGHAIGDRLLKCFADRLQSCLRSEDTVARWGGDEFTVLVPQVHNAEEVGKMAQRILDTLKPTFRLEHYELYLKSSIGIALYPNDGEDGETLVKNADVALYRAKERGGSSYCFFSPKMSSGASMLLKLENLLHRAIEREELFVCYQPQLNIKTGKISGMEALLRWRNPELGLVSPGKFIPVAEETGLIMPIGEWVLHTVCHQNQLWQSAGLPPLRVAVNLSPRQFQQPHLLSIVGRILQESGLDPNWLELEITETSVMKNVDFASKILKDFQQMGVHLSIDDFGTGYSSLSYLKQFSFNTLKIDRSFVCELEDNPQDQAIISALIALGQGFNLRVLAEGVETQQQVEILKTLQCEEIQGYWFSKPLTAEQATQFLCLQKNQVHKTSVR